MAPHLIESHTMHGVILGDEAANYIGTGDFVRHRVSFADYNVASEWINKCAGHEFCRKQEEIVLPTRVIDCSQPEKPRLLITNGLQGFYAALSYVWGGRQSQCTTMANVDSYVQGINVPLPQTIVDAMVATHKLGLRYLWVDSLCILQDSDDDKLKEIVQMRAIYENALITIIAASAYGANEGFLQDQQPTIRLPFQCPAGKVGSMLVQCKPCFDDRSLGVESGGINNRAWCLQEGILSPRQLIFSSPILIFRCRTIVANISSGFRVQTEPQAMETHLLFPNNSNVSLSDDQLSSLRSLWHQILADYPGRGMSMPSDKLVAIAGVVEAFQQVWGGNCIAGLWQQTLIEDLLWRRFAFSDSPLFPRPANYRAPSWSWAAIDGNILPHSDHFTIIPTIEYECEILECKTTPKSDLHPLGEVTDGILRINAKMEKVVWDPINCSLVEPGSLWNGTVGTSADPRTRSKDQVYPDSADEVTESIGEVWLVLMRLGKTSRSGEPWAHGLFVVPVDLEGCFCRIGTLYCCCVPDWYETTPRRIITIV
jgi:hypothetical protein